MAVFLAFSLVTWNGSWRVSFAENGALLYWPSRHEEQVIAETPPEIHKEFLLAWDKVAAKEAEKNPVFKDVYEDLKKWASVTVPAKRFYYPAYGTAADHYWPKK